VSLAEISQEIDCKVKAIIIDNSFKEAPRESVSQFIRSLRSSKLGELDVIFSPSRKNIGFGAACNKGVELCNDSHIIFTNCDTELKRGTGRLIGDMIKILDDPSVGIIGPRIIDEGGCVTNSFFSYDPISIALKPLRHIIQIGSRFTRWIPQYQSFKKRIDRITYSGIEADSPLDVNWLSGCFLAVRNDTFKQLGMFDTRYFLYFEDVDLCRKARQQQKRVIYHPLVEVIHRAQRTSASRKGIIRSLLFNRSARDHTSSWLKYCWKWRRDFIMKIDNKFGKQKFNNSSLTETSESSQFFLYSEYKHVHSSSTQSQNMRGDQVNGTQDHA
jgi:GT2 family glycosyltransferase